MDTYTHGHSESVLKSHTWRTVENSAAYLIPELVPGKRVLDVGCGPGTITVDMAVRVSPGEVIGIDAVADVLEKAQANIPAGVSNVSFAKGSVYDLDFPDDSFDIVHAHQVLQHLSDPVEALVEMRRVCKPTGLVAVRDADYRAMAWAPADDRLNRWMDMYQVVARSNDAEPDAGRYLKGWAEQAGFTEIECSAAIWCFADDEDRAWWGGLWAGRLLDSSLASQATQRKIATPLELREFSEAFTDWIDRPGAWFSVPHGQLLARP